MQNNETETFEIKKRRLLIDGDVLIHMACWQKPISKAKEKELRDLADSPGLIGMGDQPLKKGMSSEEAHEAVDAALMTYQPTIEQAQARFRHFMKHILESNGMEVGDDLFSMAIGDSSQNFRLEIHPEYKLHKARSDSNKKRAPYIQDLRMWAVEEYSAHYCQGYEADDAIGSWATRLGDDNYVIVTVDKDLNLIPGYHFDPKTEDPHKRRWYVEPEESKRFFCLQLLMGDSIDNIPGIRGIGPKKAEKILEACKTPEECMEAVVQEYDLKYGEEGYDQLMFNGQLLHIWRSMKDHWSFDKEEYEKITGTNPDSGA